MHDSYDPVQSALTVRLCKKDEHDAGLIMIWRNDPQTQAASFHRELKRWPIFWPEYRDRFFDCPDLPPHFVCLDGSPIAFLRYTTFELDRTGPSKVDISFNLSPEFRGQRLSTPVLDRSVDFVYQCGFRGTVIALIRTENVASYRSFLAAGFQDVGRFMHHVVDTGEICSIARLELEIVDKRNFAKAAFENVPWRR